MVLSQRITDTISKRSDNDNLKSNINSDSSTTLHTSNIKEEQKENTVNNNMAHTKVRFNVDNHSGDQNIEDCGVCTLMGVSDTKREMFEMMNAGGGVNNVEKDMSFWEPMPEPLDLIDLGNSGWNVLHTMAAYYPDKPTDTTKNEMKEFLHSFSKVYPCKTCAKDFQGILKDTPPQLDNQKEFAKWMCDSHNHVNQLLGKPLFDCTLVDKRWKKTSSNINH